MASQLEIRRAVNQCEEDYACCWSTLKRMREENVSSSELLDFQPLLAKAIFHLDRIYLSIKKERKHVIRVKNRSPEPSRCVKRLRQLRFYEEIVKAALRRGKALGDAFAWLFYSRSGELLNEHLNHPFNLHTPAGVGGAVEYDFVVRFRLIGKFLPIYHGCTNFLRIGDISFVDMRTLTVVGIGELKAGKISRDGVPVTLFVTTAGPAATIQELQHAISRGKGPEINAFAEFSAEISCRLKRQLARQSQILTAASKPSSKKSLTFVAKRRWMDELLNAIHLESPPYICQVSQGLVLFAIKAAKKTLYSRLTQGLNKSLERQMKSATQAAWKLATNRKLDNALWIGRLGFSFIPGGVPLLWTPLGSDVADGIFNDTLIVMTLYNPGFFIDRLRKEGFRVEYINRKPRIKLEMNHGDRWLEIHNVDFMMRLVQYHFISEEAIFETLCFLRKEVHRRPGQKIEFRFIGTGYF